VDQNTTISINGTAADTLVEFSRARLLLRRPTSTAVRCGYFISRFPKKFKVNTPFFNAAVEALSSWWWCVTTLRTLCVRSKVRG